MKISYCSLGCKVNLYECESIINQFVDNGFDLSSFNEICDVYIINTCSITATGDAKSRKMIRKAIKTNPNAIVAVMGCYSQLAPEIIKKIKGVSLIVGTNNRHMIFDLVMNQLNRKEKDQISLVDDIFKVKEYEELKINRYNHKTRGFVKIQDGCNNFCSYCTIPYARGPIRSRKPENVISEIRLLTNQGMREIVLSGINTGAYGQDFENYDLSDLIKDICIKVENIGRIRISSIEVMEINDKLINVLNEYKEHICLHLHIPLQGGTNKVLKRMNRKYDINTFSEKIKMIRDIFPDINITTDILTGFCGESEEDFKETIQFIKQIGFGELHVFPYSIRPKTIACKFLDHNDEITKHIRVNELLKINDELALNYRKQFINKELEVVVEKCENNIAFGHTSNYLEIEFFGNVKQNDVVKVKMVEAKYPISKGEYNEISRI